MNSNERRRILQPDSSIFSGEEEGEELGYLGHQDYADFFRNVSNRARHLNQRRGNMNENQVDYQLGLVHGDEEDIISGDVDEDYDDDEDSGDDRADSNIRRRNNVVEPRRRRSNQGLSIVLNGGAENSQ